MSYLIEVVRRTAQQTTNWSGGTTTQIAIYPPNAEYSKRNFVWRLSSAKVELEESSFTKLPGILRILMVLDGELTLEHQGQHRVQLKAYEQDRFCGDWTTNSFGKVSDFNLMMSQDCKGVLNVIAFEEKESITIADRSGTVDQCTAAFYCVNGTVRVAVDKNNAAELQAGDVLLLHSKAHNQKVILQISNLEDRKMELICAKIQYEPGVQTVPFTGQED